MRTYKHEVHLIRPGTQQVCASLRLLEAQLNDGRAREQVNASQLVRFWQSTGGVYPGWINVNWQWIEGHATPTFRSFREGVAVLGLAWVLTPDGALHLRIAGEVMHAKTGRLLRSDVQPWGQSIREEWSANAVAYVWPQLWIGWTPKRAAGPINNLRRWLNSHPWDRVEWSMLSDLYEESGDQVQAMRCRIAVDTLDGLRCHGVE